MKNNRKTGSELESRRKKIERICVCMSEKERDGGTTGMLVRKFFSHVWYLESITFRTCTNSEKIIFVIFISDIMKRITAIEIIRQAIPA